MQKKVVKYFLIVFLSIIYINRGLFVSPSLEMYCQGRGEINSVFELLLQLSAGICNDIDEDGEMQSDFNSVNINPIDFSQPVSQHQEQDYLFSNLLCKFALPADETIPFNHFSNPIDPPPKLFKYFG